MSRESFLYQDSLNLTRVGSSEIGESLSDYSSNSISVDESSEGKDLSWPRRELRGETKITFLFMPSGA